MKTHFSYFRQLPIASSWARRAFSLIEVLVVTGLLSVIILGLVLMFGQTQRAYKLGTTQVDVLEGGRMVSDMLSREVAQMSPTYVATSNCLIVLRNFAPLVQELPGNVPASPDRTNLLMEFFFHTKENQTMTGIGYTVLDPATGAHPQGGVGTLFRYSTNRTIGLNNYQQFLPQLYETFRTTSVTNMSRVLDGVVHFKVRAFNAKGDWINHNDFGDNIYTNLPTDLGPLRANYPFGEVPVLTFVSNAVPASLEIELGLLEEKTAERARSISTDAARLTYLGKEAAKVHIFRWRVPVRNVDPTAYQ